MQQPFKNLAQALGLSTEEERKRTRAAEVKARAKSARSKAKVEKAEPTRTESEEEQTLFEQAMTGIKPLKGRGREVPTPVVQAVGRSPAEPHDPVRDLARIVNGECEFLLEFTNEYMQGRVQGLDQRTLDKLKAGVFSVENHLDLHGMNSDQAQIALTEFIRSSYVSGRKCVLVVTGRGRNSPHGMSVLRQELQVWLTRYPLKRIVLAFATAQPRHGGAGAIYVLLRSLKKQRGKVLWEEVFVHLEG
ncbi:MAG: DNA mismatch repair protein MutS [Deltaproteobacteria bacterium]|nr:DNA mismatch repair protein MutS [Deltaproteobacteria bacterium]